MEKDNNNIVQLNKKLNIVKVAICNLKLSN